MKRSIKLNTSTKEKVNEGIIERINNKSKEITKDKDKDSRIINLDKDFENEFKEIKLIKNNKLQINSVNISSKYNHNSIASKTTKISNESTINYHHKSSKNSNNINLIFSEADCPEELHMLYVNLHQQNKSLAFKFERDVKDVKDINSRDDDFEWK